jgi:IrrE N-terminal-like domain
MTMRWEGYLGNDPALYARKVLRECGCKAPPISELTVMDYLGLELKEITRELIHSGVGDSPTTPELLSYFRTEGAWLQRNHGGRKVICVYRHAPLGRKRVSIFHECGHAIIPWHAGVNYLCKDKNLDPPLTSRLEREAFLCGSEFLLPREMFVPDTLSLKIGMAAIEQLRDRYRASLEATAVWYAQTYPGRCALAMVKPAGNRKTRALTEDDHLPAQFPFPFEFPSISVPAKDESRDLLKVKYFVKSRRFTDYIRPGRGIREGNPLFEVAIAGKPFKGEIWGSIFETSPKRAYHVECIPRGEMALILIWLPDPQLRFDY